MLHRYRDVTQLKSTQRMFLMMDIAEGFKVTPLLEKRSAPGGAMVMAIFSRPNLHRSKYRKLKGCGESLQMES
jgi:hypothetical protein